MVLNKPGISGSARKLILRRHTTSIVLFFVCNLYIFTFTVYVCYKLPLDVTTTPWWQIVLKVLYFSQGIMGPLIRGNEVAFRSIVWKTIKQDLKWLVCMRDAETKEEETMTPLFLFLASSFNTELVYVILKGITQFSYFINMNGTDKK